MTTELQVKDVLPVIRGEFSNIRLPTAGDKVYNDECVYSFDTPFSDTGLFVSLRTFQGVGARYLQEHSAKTGSKLYVHCKWTQVRKSIPEGAVEATPMKLAIGVEGGFNVGGDLEVVKENKLAVIVDFSCAAVETSKTCTFPLSDPTIPEFVVKICEGIVEHAGLRPSVLDNDSWSGDEPKMISKYADGLPFVENGKKISNDPSTWKCEASGETNNLWLNLSTGYIGGGRRNWDGSGGSGAALQHYIDTGRQYPLCVKLGTITPHGADVWSYAADEDTLVLDPHLSEHLSRLGIDIMKLEKTDKTLSEMDVEMNLKYDWARIMEGGKDIQAVSGPGLIGLRNIGSSCYLNSVLQTLCAVPELADRYFLNEDRIRLSAPSDAENDFPLQMSKLVSALLSDRYVIPADILTMSSDTISKETSLEKYVVSPRMFKQLVARGHREFSSGRQQDASEYFQHLLNAILRSERTALRRIVDSPDAKSTNSLFEFFFQTRLQVTSSGQVKYIGKKEPNNVSNILELRIPEEMATNRVEVEQFRESKRQKVELADEDLKLHVPFEVCLNTIFSAEEISLGVNGSMVSAAKTVGLIDFPKYLMVKLGRYTINSSWQQVKIDACVPVPEVLDLNHLRASGPQPGEVLIEENDSGGGATTAERIVPDETIVAQLESMGFSENACRRAAIATKNASAEVAMQWVFEHMEDPDFNNPIETVAATVESSGAGPFETENLVSLGFSEAQARKALKSTNNDVERAAEWLFSHPDDDGSEDLAGAAAEPSTGAADIDPAGGVYDLIGIISHLGRNTDCGHYVCHLKKDGQWYFYNDDKVALSSNPPFDCGFMYLFKRRE